MQGVDSACGLGGVAAQLAAQGVRLAGRYYSFDPRKNLTRREAEQLAAAGLSIVAIWEADGDVIAGFDAAKGALAAKIALELAASCGQPPATAIYFAVDFDASREEIDGPISDYFRALQPLQRAGYSIGAYGSGLVCGRLIRARLARFAYLAQSRGWRGTANYRGAQIEQGPPVTVCGVPVDLFKTTQDQVGAWQAARDPVPAAIVTLQTALHESGLYTGALDGIWGAGSEAALAEWQRRRG